LCAWGFRRIFSPEIQIATDADEKGYVYVHVSFPPPQDEMWIRIWRTTYLTDRNSPHESRLVHAENISYAPQWTSIPAGSHHSFLLIFEGLPKSCSVFDLIERIDQPGGFAVSGIVRNEADVYRVSLD
jgi:hypothetical protein